MPMSEENKKLLKLGFDQAREITKRHAKTFYFSSLFLSKDKQDASYCVYALCRLSDESVDKNSRIGRTELEKIKKDIQLCYSDEETENPLLLAARQILKNYKIPKEYFDSLLSGMQMDLDKKRYVNFTELYDYCYKVAGIVGLIMLRILGSSNEEAKRYAVDLGIAMQLTNILRDISEDYERGRIYLPQDEMGKYEINEATLADKKVTENFKRLISFQIQRAREFYKRSQEGITFFKDSKSRFVIKSMKEIYSSILASIEKNDYDVFSKRAHVDALKKSGIALKLFIRGN